MSYMLRTRSQNADSHEKRTVKGEMASVENMDESYLQNSINLSKSSNLVQKDGQRDHFSQGEESLHLKDGLGIEHSYPSLDSSKIQNGAKTSSQNQKTTKAIEVASKIQHSKIQVLIRSKKEVFAHVWKNKENTFANVFITTSEFGNHKVLCCVRADHNEPASYKYKTKGFLTRKEGSTYVFFESDKKIFCMGYYRKSFGDPLD